MHPYIEVALTWKLGGPMPRRLPFSDLEPILAVGLGAHLDGDGAGVEAILIELLRRRNRPDSNVTSKEQINDHSESA